MSDSITKTQTAFFSFRHTELSLNPFLSIENHIRLFGDVKLLSIIFSVGAILGARLLPAQGKPVEIFQRDVKGGFLRGVTLCNDIHGCRGSYVESSKRRDLASLVWARASGERAAGEGAQGQGAQGEGAQGESSGNPPSEGPGVSPSRPASEPSDFLATSDRSLSDRPSSDIRIDDSSSDISPESQEVLPLSEYAANSQSYYDLMMGAVHRMPKREPTYASFNDRYRLRTWLLYCTWSLLQTPHPARIAIDLKAEDWTFRMLTAKGHPMPDKGSDIEDDATIVTYGSQSQKTIIVTKPDSIINDIPDPANPDVPKVPNSELMFQLLQKQAGGAVSDTRLIIRHVITQKGTIAVLRDAHESKGLAPTNMGAWTAADGEVYRRLLGNRNGRLGVFMPTDHPTAMKCKVVTRVFTWAQIPGDVTGKGAMAMEIGTLDSC